MAKKDRSQGSEPPLPCPRCSQLEDQLVRSEQRSHERMRELSDICRDLQVQLSANQQGQSEALQRLKALRARLTPA